MATYKSRAEFENEANKKKLKDLTSKIELEQRSNKAKAEINKKLEDKKLKGGDPLPTDPIGDPIGPQGGGPTLVYGCTDANATNYNPLANTNDGSCVYGFVIPGCTDALALNYNSLANVDDGSCDYCIYGCTNSVAANYNPLATCDDGSCILEGCTDPQALNYSSLATVPNYKCRWEGCTDASALNYVGLAPTAGLGLTPVTGQVYSWLNPLTGDGGEVYSLNTTCNYPVRKGCMDPLACNYDPNANIDDGSCYYSGCTDTTADNYDITVLADCNCNTPSMPGYQTAANWNSCCTYTIYGCTDINALNYNPAATVDDGSCTYSGCMTPGADNYDSSVVIDDGSCVWSGCTDPLSGNYSFAGSNVDGPNGIFTYLTGNAVDNGSCTYDDPRDPCYQIGDITSTINGGAGGMVFALPNTTSNPTSFYFEVSLVDLSTGGTSLDHYYNVKNNPVSTLADINITCGEPGVNAAFHDFKCPWFESIDISIPNDQVRWGYGPGSFQPSITTPPGIGAPTGVNIGDPVEALSSTQSPLFPTGSQPTIIDIEIIPAGANVTSAGQLVSSLLYDSYLFTFNQSMVAPPLSQPVKILTTGGIIIGGPFTTSGAEWGAYEEPLQFLPPWFDEGQNNTDQIVNYPALPVWPTHTTAAELCNNYSTTLTSQDWFLPSLDEFDLMYNKLGPGTPHAAALNLTIGINTSEMMDDVYWTSSDLMDGGPAGAGFYYAQAYSVNPGPWSSVVTPIPVGPVAVTRCSSLSVRAIRKFQCQEEITLDPNRFGWTDANVKNRWRSYPITINNQDVNFSGLLTPGAMGSGFGRIRKGDLLPSPLAIGCMDPTSPAYDPDHVIQDVSCGLSQLPSYSDPTTNPNQLISYEGVIGLPEFNWQPCTTDCAGNIWSLDDFNDANNPDGYTFKVWSADGTYEGTWHYQNCEGQILGSHNNNWIKGHATINNASAVNPATPWYDSVPNPDSPGEIMSKTFPDKLALTFKNATHIDGPHQVVNYAYSRNDNQSKFNIIGAPPGYTIYQSGQPFAWSQLSTPQPLGPGYTTHHTNYFNEYYEEAWLGHTAGFAFFQMDSRMSKFKPNAQPNVFTSTNNVYQQRKVVCAKQVFDDIKNNQSNVSLSYLYSQGSHVLDKSSGGHIGIGGWSFGTNPGGTSNTTYGNELVIGDNGLMQNLNRYGSPSGASRYPKHHFHPWYADYPPPPNSGLQLYNNLATAINLLQNEDECIPNWMLVTYPPQPADVHTWNICGIKDINGQVVPFNNTWLAPPLQGPVKMDYLGAGSTGDDFYNDIVTTLGVVNVNNIVAVDISVFGTGFLPIASYQVSVIYFNYAGILPWSQTLTINGLPGQPGLTLFNDCGSALNLSLTDPNDNNTARLSNINLNNENSYQLQGDVNLQNVNKRTPLKIITYINNIPLYSKVKDAIDWGKQYGLEGYHDHTYKGMVGYMAGENHKQSIKATEEQVIPQAVLESYQEPEEVITPQQQQYIPPVEAPQPTPPRTTYGGGSSGGGGGY